MADSPNHGQADGAKTDVRHRNLTEGSIVGALGFLALPNLVTSLLGNVLNIMDALFVGRLGPDAIAAVALGGILMGGVWTLLVGVSIGTVAMVARFVGARDTSGARRAAAQAYILALGASILLALLAGGIPEMLMRAIGGTPEVARLGAWYVRFAVGGAFTLVFMFTTNAILRGAGDARWPMVFGSTAVLLNLVLDPILIFGLGPVPRLGVTGAGLATFLAQGIGMLLAFWVLITGRSALQLHLGDLSLRPRTLWQMVKITIPGSLQEGVGTAATMITIHFTAAFGTLAVAAYGIGMRLDHFMMMPGWALTGATAALVGQNLGAGKPDRAARTVWCAVGIHAMFLVAASAMFLFLAPQIVHAFDKSGAVVAEGARYLRTRAIGYVLLSLSQVCAGGLNGAGDSVSPLLVNALARFAIGIPLVILLPTVGDWGVGGVWAAITIAIAAQGLGTGGWFLVGRWRGRRIAG